MDRLHADEGGKKVKGGKFRSRSDKKQGREDPDRVLRILLDYGLITKTRNCYRRNSLTVSGTIRVNTSGHAVCVTGDGDPVLIDRDSSLAARDEDTAEVLITDIGKEYPLGVITRIVTKKRTLLLGKVEQRNRRRAVVSVLDDPKGKEVVLKEDLSEYPPGSYVLLKREEDRGATLLGEFPIDEEEYDFRRIQLKHALPEEHPEYEELRGIDMTVPAGEIRIRADFRDLLTVTIDGEDAKDFDDALSLAATGSGWILYVHIADVSHYVKKDGELDREAQRRGTSCYLGEKVIPMLPEILSNDLCSLRAAVDRLAMTAELHYDRRGNLLRHRFHKSVITVDRRLTYNSAEALLGAAGTGDDQAVRELLLQLFTLTRLLKELRIKEGRLDLNLTDVKMVFENGRIKELKAAERLRSHMIIEECMLSANVAVSRELKEQGVPALYRIHEDIAMDSLVKLRDFLKYLHIKLPLKGKSGIHLQKIIETVAGQEYDQVVNMAILKSLMQAYYGPEPVGHYGLAFPDYTHFTSPIRRYPDLVVHRCLKSLIEGKKPPYGYDTLSVIGETSSATERTAQKAERDLVKLKSCRLMAGSLGREFKAVISGVARFGFFVTLTDSPVEGMVPLRNLTDDYYLVMEDDYTIVGKRYGKRYRLGDRLTVYLERVDIEEMKIDFALQRP